MMKRWMLIGLVMLMAGNISLQGAFMRGTSPEVVRKSLARFGYSVVLFYEKQRRVVRDANLYRAIQDLEGVMLSLSKNPDYREADLLIMCVDVSRRDYHDLLAQYQVTALPSIRFFRGTQMVGGFNGFVSRKQLESAIAQYFQEPMDRTLQEKARQRKREFERAQINAAYWAPYWGPYWVSGYYPYWNGPTFAGPYGFYVGW